MDDGVELPGSSYEQLVKIIQGYTNSTPDKKLSNHDVEKASGVPHSEVSRNGKFLIQIGILEGGQQKFLSESGQQLARAYTYDRDDEVGAIWRRLLSENDFAQQMLSAVRIRRGMDLRDFQSHVAYSAGSNKKNIKTGAATFVRILEVAKLIENDNGIVAVNSNDTQKRDSDSLSSGTVLNTRNSDGNQLQVSSDVSDVPETPVGTAEPSKDARADFQIRINVNVSATIDDLERLPELLAAVRAALEDQADASIGTMSVENQDILE